MRSSASEQVSNQIALHGFQKNNTYNFCKECYQKHLGTIIESKAHNPKSERRLMKNSGARDLKRYGNAFYKGSAKSETTRETMSKNISSREEEDEYKNYFKAANREIKRSRSLKRSSQTPKWHQVYKAPYFLLLFLLLT